MLNKTINFDECKNIAKECKQKYISMQKCNYHKERHALNYSHLNIYRKQTI